MTSAPVASLSSVTHQYGATSALSDVTLDIPPGCMAGLIGPDGLAPKETLIGRSDAAVQLSHSGPAFIMWHFEWPEGD